MVSFPGFKTANCARANQVGISFLSVTSAKCSILAGIISWLKGPNPREGLALAARALYSYLFTILILDFQPVAAPLRLISMGHLVQAPSARGTLMALGGD